MELSFANGQGSITVSEAAFGLNKEFNEALVHQVMVAYLAGARQGTRAQKTRGEVNGSNKKPWSQKKTGNARAGDRKGPLWRKGGVTFAAQPQDHSQKVNKKMYRGALRSIFGELIRQNRLVVVPEFNLETHKTKELVAKLNAMNLESCLIVDADLSLNLMRAGNNLYNVGVCYPDELNPVSLVSFKHVVVTASAVKVIEEMLQ